MPRLKKRRAPSQKKQNDMKAKTLLTLLLLTVTLLLNAQKASLNNAYNHFYEKDYVKAKEAIDLCVQNEKLSAKAQTWLYKGNIYFYLAALEADVQTQKSVSSITMDAKGV